MTDIRWHFALVDPPDSAGPVFVQDYARNDYRRTAIDGRLIGSVLSFEFEQEEGDFATLRIAVANPRVGLLSGRIWLWFSYSINGGDAVPRFFGRLVGVPTSIFDEVVTLEFIGRPADFMLQKEALAQSLRVLPYYDPAFIEESRRADPDVVLEGYTKLWHIDPITHAVTVSDVLSAEDGVEEFTASEMLARGLQLSLEEVPLTEVVVDATMPWTQRATGSVDITDHIVDNWPNEHSVDIEPGVITSFTLKETDWPKPFSAIGSGWQVDNGACVPVYDLTVKSRSETLKTVINWGQWGGGETTSELSYSDQYLQVTPPGSIDLGVITVSDEVQIQRDPPDLEAGQSNGEISSFSRSLTYVDSVIPLVHLRPTLTVTYQAERPRKERVRFTLTADVQPILTDPGDDQALLLTLNADDLSTDIDVAQSTTGFEPPIGDSRRRSYVVTPRGELSLQYLICVARAPLVRRSRAVRITFEPVSLARMADISLRKNARIHDPRLPGGVALGKIVAYRIALDGNSGILEKSVTMGCAIGRGGEVAAVEGEPDYVEESYIGPDQDYQEYLNRRIVFDSAVGYEPLTFEPNDDGFDFLAGLTADDIIVTPLSVENPPAAQRIILEEEVGQWAGGGHSIVTLQSHGLRGQESIDARTEYANDILEQYPTIARFKLVDMKAAFENERTLVVSQLKIPNMINLEAA